MFFACKTWNCWTAFKAQIHEIGSWAVKMSHEEEWADIFAKRSKSVVYLTADSDNLLDEIDEECTYVIGALVDRNRLKHCTIKKAERLGMATARLPLKEHSHLWRGGTPHLTVNTVVELIHARRAFPDWEGALSHVLPPRKSKRPGERDSVKREGADVNDAVTRAAEDSPREPAPA